MKMTGSHRAEIIRNIFADIIATIKKNYGKDLEELKKKRKTIKTI